MPSVDDLLLLDVVGTDRFRARHNLDNYAGKIAFLPRRARTAGGSSGAARADVRLLVSGRVVGSLHLVTAAVRSLVSLNESLWFHHPVRTDEWLLYRTGSHWADHGCGFARGLMFNRAGGRVASVAQEALLRMS